MQKTLLAPTPKSNGSVQTTNLTQRDQTVFSVLRTTDYEKFKLLPNNRNLNLLHVRRLVESFKNKYLVCPIIVNEKLEVIDGQHRLRGCKETGSPIYYIVIPGYGIDEVQILNTHQKNWTKYDFLTMYCAEGVRPYLELKEFMDQFPDFSIQSAERIIRLLASNPIQSKVVTKQKDFEEGKLLIPNLQKSYLVARKILDFKPFFKEYHSGVFVSAVMPLIMKSKVYNHKEMIHKLSTCPIKLSVRARVTEYRILLEDIYNYKRQKENKVSFKYE